MSKQIPESTMTEKKPEVTHYKIHFRLRLKERYGINITDAEYFELCKRPIELIYKISPNKRFGKIKINEKDVYVIRCNASKLLNTCLAEDNPMPMPLVYKKAGLELNDFKKDLFNAVHKINKLVAWLNDKCKTEADKKFYFVEHPYKYKNWMYGLGYYKWKREADILNKICYHICQKVKQNIKSETDTIK